MKWIFFPRVRVLVGAQGVCGEIATFSLCLVYGERGGVVGLAKVWVGLGEKGCGRRVGERKGVCGVEERGWCGWWVCLGWGFWGRN